MIASAMTEHSNSGQIGHPAASMMANKDFAPQKIPRNFICLPPIQQARRPAAGLPQPRTTLCLANAIAGVLRAGMAAEPAAGAAVDKPVQNLYKPVTSALAVKRFCRGAARAAAPF
jgi:hypothetical protein